MFHKNNIPVLAFVMLPAFAQQQQGGTSVWLWLLIAAIVVVIFFFLLRGARKGELGGANRSTMTAEPAARPVTEHVAAMASPVEEEAPSIGPAIATLSFQSEVEEITTPTPDDLKLIEGIGPKIASILNTRGIYTFAQLACVEPDELRKMMQDAGLRLAAPDTWPAQAQLAADGKLDELKALQDHLKGGRKV